MATDTIECQLPSSGGESPASAALIALVRLLARQAAKELIEVEGAGTNTSSLPSPPERQP